MGHRHEHKRVKGLGRLLEEARATPEYAEVLEEARIQAKYDIPPKPKNERLYINATLNELFEDNKDQRFQFQKSRDK